jgi:ribosomal protein S18 acetylase RimI-like enzyme
MLPLMSARAKANRIRDGVPTDASQVVAIDAIASAGGSERRASIERWIASGSMGVAVGAGEIVGYCVTERAFFGHWFVVMLMVAEGARGQGVGAELLLDAQQKRKAAKLLTSTNLSNQPMQRLLARLGWRSAGIVYGLDGGDPELFYLAPNAATGLS